MKEQIKVNGIWYEVLYTGTSQTLVKNCIQNPFFPSTIVFKKKQVSGWRLK